MVKTYKVRSHKVDAHTKEVGSGKKKKKVRVRSHIQSGYTRRVKA